ncbi:ladderlectin-like isoform X1 [Channa argus]|uniref:ladderlectin-like isoform X1 n=1 Tax=Channa argus TaxID=215402 RepID=UPI0035227534
MKILAVCVLGCAVVVLVGAAAVEEEKAQNDQTGINNLDKRYTLYHRGWSRINGRDFFFVPSLMTWYQAEKYCQSIGANLASVHNALEHRWLQKLIFVATHYYKEAWIGGSDAQQKGIWFWSDGSRFRYTYWCRGEPNNSYGRQHCLQINQGAHNCWGDLQCYTRRPSICVKKRC